MSKKTNKEFIDDITAGIACIAAMSDTLGTVTHVMSTGEDLSKLEDRSELKKKVTEKFFDECAAHGLNSHEGMVAACVALFSILTTIQEMTDDELVFPEPLIEELKERYHAGNYHQATPGDIIGTLLNSHVLHSEEYKSEKCKPEETKSRKDTDALGNEKLSM